MSAVENPWDGALSELVSRFVSDPDLIGTLTWLTERCAELPGVRASAVAIADQRNVLDVLAASSDLADQLQQLEHETAEGPTHDSYANNSQIDCTDLDSEARWPAYAPVARRGGIRAIHAFPMPLPGRIIGVLTTYLPSPGGLPTDLLEAVQLLASTAALGVECHQAEQHEIRADQLQTALHSRVAIEQAKGVLAERLGISPDEAFAVLRTHARRNGHRLIDVSIAVINGTLTLSTTPPR